MSLDANDPRPPYVQVAETVARAITTGEMKPGERLPSIRELSDRYGVAPMTIQHALRILRERGLIVSWQGRGSYVREPGDEAGQPATGPAGAESTYDDLIRHLGQIQEQLDQLDQRVTEIEKTTTEKKSR